MVVAAMTFRNFMVNAKVGREVIDPKVLLYYRYIKIVAIAMSG